MNLDYSMGINQMVETQRIPSGVSNFPSSLPTPIGPKDMLEVVDTISPKLLLSSMDITTTRFLRETFSYSMPSQSAAGDSYDFWNLDNNNQKLARILEVQDPDLMKFPNSDLLMVNNTRTPYEIHSDKLLISSSKIMSSDDLPGPSSMSLSRSSSSSSSSHSSSSSEAAEATSVKMAATTTTTTKRGHWVDKYNELVEFHKRFGHCLVPNNWSENVKLSQWVKRQRHQYKCRQQQEQLGGSEGAGKSKNSNLTPDRIQALENLGFVWSVQEDTWEERFSELCAYKEVYGHTNVPKNCKTHTQLSVWVKYQRRHLKLFIGGKRSSMTSDRFSKLTKVGFQWNPRRKRSSESSVEGPAAMEELPY